MKMKLMALMALMALTACDQVRREEVRREQGDRLYRSAMDDYQAGRLDAAVAGFQRVVREDPANASARFQLACLLQDAKHDWLGAFCGYREFLLQHPNDDKSSLAKDRLAQCERMLAAVLASKYGLNKSEDALQAVDALRRELKDACSRAAAAEKNFADSQARVLSLSEERSRLLAMVKDAGSADAGIRDDRPNIKEVKDLLEEIDETEGDRIQLSKDVAALRMEEKEHVDAPSALPPPPATPIEPKPEPKTAPKQERRDFAPTSTTERPETYIVEDGDTLYGVSKRFYGTVSAWRKIKDANKTVISADNRLRAGDTLRLP